MKYSAIICAVAIGCILASIAVVAAPIDTTASNELLYSSLHSQLNGIAEHHAPIFQQAAQEAARQKQAANGVDEEDIDVSSSGYTPSAVPLFMLSPEVNVWSFKESLYDEHLHHWSGANMTMNGALRVDDVTYRWMGLSTAWSGLPTLQQISMIVLPASTLYQFQAPAPHDSIHLNVMFTTPGVSDANNETELSRPYGYITVSVNNTSPSTSYHVSLYVDVHADWVLDTKVAEGDIFGQQIAWDDWTPQAPSQWITQIVRNYDNIPFSVKGDYVKMNWGHFFMSTVANPFIMHTVAAEDVCQRTFSDSGNLPVWDPEHARTWDNQMVSSAFVWDFQQVASGASTGGFMLLGYNDVVSMNYFGEWQVPLWRHTYGDNEAAMIQEGLALWHPLIQRSIAFDNMMFAALQSAGGDAYALLASLAHRQTAAGLKGVWSEVNGDSRWYMKEISSDGDVSTIDVIYPASPWLLTFAPHVLRKLLLPVFDYALNRTDISYNLAWAPHHLGFWPVCDITPGQQEQMPMEESGNFFLMLMGTVSEEQGDISWLSDYWSLLSQWGDYITTSLPDPGNQLCTDDFEGPSPHNVNLALKGIVALGAYSQLLAVHGETSKAEQVMTQAQAFVDQWMNMSADAGHSRLQYDMPGSWSQKYNLLYQYILGLPQLFPASVMTQEIQWLAQQFNTWGLPLDSRGALTKTDWSSWMAAMAGTADNTDEAAATIASDFSDTVFIHLLSWQLTGPSVGVPFSDFYSTDSGKVLGFRARPVQGGIWAKYLLKNKTARTSNTTLQPVPTTTSQQQEVSEA